MNAFATALAPLQARMKLGVRSLTPLRPISRVQFDLTDSNAFDGAIDIAKGWMLHKARIRPTQDDRLTDIDYSSPDGRTTIRTLALSSGYETVWAAAMEEPGSNPTANETWCTEVFVERRPGSLVRMGVRLSARRPVTPQAATPNRPRLVHDIITSLSAQADGYTMDDAVTCIEPAEIEQYAEHLYDPERRLPIVALYADENGRTMVDPAQLSRRLSGVAHLTLLNPKARWELSRLLPRRLGASEGAIRLFMPGLVQGEEEPFAHPLWLPIHSRRNVNLIDHIANIAFPLGFHDRDGDAPFWSIAHVREVIAQIALTQARADETAGTAEAGLNPRLLAEVEAAQSRISVLEADLESADALLEEATIRDRSAEKEIAQLREEIDVLKQTNYALRIQVEHNAGNDDALTVDMPLESYDHLEEWATKTLGPHIRIHKRALKECREDGHPAQLKRIEQILLVLRDVWIPWKIEGGLDRRDAARAALAALGVEDEPCFAPRESAKHKPEYQVPEGVLLTRVLYDHFKYGNSRSNANQIRMYYAYDDEEQRLIIGKMPSHLTTAAS